MDNRPTSKSNTLDQVAVALSGLCLLHCLLLPIVIVALPFLGQFSDDHFHVQMLLVVVPVSLVALGTGFRRHRDARIILTGVAGLALLIVGSSIVHSRYGLLADSVVTICGSLILGLTHYANSRLSRRHRMAFSR